MSDQVRVILVISFIIGTIMLLLGIWLIRHRRRQARVRAEQDRIERGRARAAQVHAERKRRIALQTQSPAQIHGEQSVGQLPWNLIVYVSCPKYIRDDTVGLDDVYGPYDCYAIAPSADLSQVVDAWSQYHAGSEDPQVMRYFDHYRVKGNRTCATFIIKDEAQLEHCTEGREQLLQRCRENQLSLRLDLGDGYYRNLLEGTFEALKCVKTWHGAVDDAATYGLLEWQEVTERH